jgi:menaquinone-dependent protoporphyrinogen oxidase
MAGGVVKVLVAYGSKHGGTAGLAERMGQALRNESFDVDVRAAADVSSVDAYEAVIVGGALYAFHWFEDARRFVLRHHQALRARETYFFSSGPLDASATERAIPPTTEVDQLMRYVGARGHATFGGRLEATVSGFPESAMAKKNAGDWRDWAQIDRWAHDVGSALAGPRSERLAPEPLPSRALSLGLNGILALTALAGGSLLVARPDGSADGLSTAILVHTPFHDFLVPGLVLLTLVGLPAAWSARRTYVRDPYACFWSLLSGLSITAWILIEMLLLRTASPLELAYLALGATILVDATRKTRSLTRDWTTAAKRELYAARAEST